MITEVTGNILENTCDMFVCPVNCKGVMGKGLALQVKKAYPEVYKVYKSFCDGACPDAPPDKPMEPGGFIATQFAPNRYCVCLATKDDWRNPSELRWIKEGVKNLKELCIKLGMSVAIPKIGCGLGGLDWCDVKPIIEQEFADTNIDVHIYNQ